MNKKSISVVLPAYNEGKNIRGVIEKVFSFLKGNFSDFEIIVVDDGSRDDTYSVCQAVKAELGSALEVLRHLKNRGYGAALRTGLFSAAKNLVFYTDSDRQFDITELLKFTEAINNADYVIGYRLDRKDPFIRRLAARGYNWLIRMVFGLKVKDIDCSFKLFRKDCLRQLSIERDRFFVDTELLIKAGLKGFKLKQIGVKHFPRQSGKSTVKISHIFTTLGDMFYVWKKIRIKDKGKSKKDSRYEVSKGCNSEYSRKT